MTFQQFWPLYLQGHRLPGTRALHYFATIVGVSAAIAAAAALQPLILVGGIILGYAMAISSHRFVEGNQPLIRVNAFWGQVADLRMCWLAITGKLARELDKHGVARTGFAAVDDADAPAPSWFGSASRHALTVISAAGLLAGLMDLHDLIEPSELLAYPTVQLGTPILAFAAALLASCMAQFAARRDHAVFERTAVRSAAMTIGHSGFAPVHPSADDTSLQRACLALLIVGFVAFGTAELVENGVPDLHDLRATAATSAAALRVV